MKITIGAVDPSLRNFGMVKGTYDTDTGILSLDKLFIVSTEKDPKAQYTNMDDLRRANQLHNGMVNWFSDVDVIFAELPVGSQNANAAKSYGLCIGIFSGLKQPVLRVAAEDSKVRLTGKKTASKKDMIQAAKALYPELNWYGTSTHDEHLADAVAAALVGVESTQFKLIQLGLKNATDNPTN